MVFRTKEGKYRIKIVLYGPSLSGKTAMITTLTNIVRGKRSRIYSVEEPTGRTLYFDYMVFQPSGLNKFVFDIFTVPGQKRHARQRRVILYGADCVIFVADSDPRALYENTFSFEELMHAYGGHFSRIPLLIALNKRDLEDALPVKVMLRALKLRSTVPIFETVAITGEGVLAMFKEALRLTMLARFFPAIYEREKEIMELRYEKLLPREVIKRTLVKV